MRKTNEELDALIADQEDRLAEAAGRVDVHRGHVSRALGQEAGNRAAAIRALESRKETETVNLRAGL